MQTNTAKISTNNRNRINMSNNENNNEQGFTTSFSPLDENVVQRDYTRPKVQIEDSAPIEEPQFAVPSFEELDNNFKSQLGEDDPSESVDTREVWGREEEVSSANPYVENLDKKEQKRASQAMVDAVLDGYGSLKKWSNNLIKLDPKKIKKAINDGEIDGTIGIPLGGGQVVPLLDYVDMYNEETSEAISMSDEFREKVSPVLLRVFMKRGIGMTDEQLLAYYFGMDIITTGAQIFALRSQNNALIAQLKEMSDSGNKPIPNTTKEELSTEPENEDEPTSPRTPPPSPSPQETQYSEERPTEYYEPEEVATNTPAKRNRNTEFTQVEVLDDLQPEPTVKKTRKSRIIKSSNIPQFGDDTELLNNMEKIARQESQRGKRKRK